jgi:hypothetical protein
MSVSAGACRVIDRQAFRTPLIDGIRNLLDQERIMPETIISHLAAKIDAINDELEALENEPAQMAADGQPSLAWGDGYINRSNILSDSVDALTESISQRPAVDLKDALIQLQLAARVMCIVNGSDDACPMTETVERLIVNALPAVMTAGQYKQ